MGRRGTVVLVATAVAAVVAGCGTDSGGSTWVASEVYVVDDRASCMTVTAQEDGRELGVCRDDRGGVACRNGGDPDDIVSGAECDAAVSAVLAWEEDGIPETEDGA
jgi:hypothetical protein